MTEVWKPVVGFEGLYEVSDLGRVRSLDRIREGRNHFGPFKFKRPGAMLKPRVDRDGYIRVVLNNYGPQDRFVHHLVLEAFGFPRPEGLQTRHLNGSRKDNRLLNLAWGDGFEQCADKKRHGTLPLPKGELNGAAKLTTQQVHAMRRLYAEGAKQDDLAAAYDITQPNVSLVVNRKAWVHV